MRAAPFVSRLAARRNESLKYQFPDLAFSALNIVWTLPGTSELRDACPFKDRSQDFSARLGETYRRHRFLIILTALSSDANARPMKIDEQEKGEFFDCCPLYLEISCFNFDYIISSVFIIPYGFFYSNYTQYIPIPRCLFCFSV